MKVLKSLILGVVCLSLAAGLALAQSQPKKFINVLTVHVKPEGVIDYEAFAKKVMAAAEKIAYPQRVLGFQVTSGGPGFTYMFVTYFDTWKEADGILSTAEILNKALGAAEAEKVLRAGRATIESTEMEVFRLIPDLSTKPRVYDPPPAYFQIIRTEVKPDMTREWERVIGRYKTASEQMSETPSATRRVSMEGKGAVYFTATPYNTGAERDAWPSFQDVLTKAYGDEEARSLDASRASCVERSQAFIVKHRPDLSHLGK